MDEALKALLEDAAALLAIYSGPATRDGANESTAGQARALVRDIRAAIAKAEGK